MKTARLKTLILIFCYCDFEYPSLKGTAWKIGASTLFSNIYRLKLNPIFMLYYWLN